MIEDFISLFFPHYCIGCNGPLAKQENSLCTSCMGKLPKTNYHLQEYNPLLKRISGYVPYKFVLAYLKFNKHGIVQHLLHQLKYNHCEEIGDLVGKWYGDDLANSGFKSIFDLIVPVPLHMKRLKMRGYNQSDSFARGLSEKLEVEWSPHVVKRDILNISQTTKKRLERYKNVDDIFTVVDESKILGKHILVVDDVVTTGATLDACASAILKAKPKDISFAAIASAE